METIELGPVLEEISQPNESLLRQSIMVERPLSWIVKVIGCTGQANEEFSAL